MTAPDGRPVVDTAQFLAEREFAEETGRYPAHGAQPPAGASGAASYADAIGDVGYARDEQGGRVHAPEGAVEPQDYERAPHPYAPLGTAGAADKAIDARVESSLNAYANEAQRAEGLSGLDSERLGYERAEFGQTQMNELRDDVALGAGAGMTPVPQPARSVTAVFADVTSARAAVQALQDIGIPPQAISMLARGASGDEGATTPAGADSVRIDSPALPNDEDLPSTVAAQTGEPAAEAPTPGPPSLTESTRGGSRRPRARSSALRVPPIRTSTVISPTPTPITALRPRKPPRRRARPRWTTRALTRPPMTRMWTPGWRCAGSAFGGLTGLLVGLGALAIPGTRPNHRRGPPGGGADRPACRRRHRRARGRLTRRRCAA